MNTHTHTKQRKKYKKKRNTEGEITSVVVGIYLLILLCIENVNCDTCSNFYIRKKKKRKKIQYTCFEVDQNVKINATDVSLYRSGELVWLDNVVMLIGIIIEASQNFGVLVY